MHQLRVPSAPFAIAALEAAVESGFLGSLLLLCRKLDSDLEQELRENWSDLDDLTHEDLLVLLTGLYTKPGESIVVSDRRQRHIYGDGVHLAGSREDFNQRFDALLKFSEPVPRLSDDEGREKRLIDSEGVTEIRRALQIAESDIPVLLVRSHPEQREILIRLASDSGVFSPTKLIHEIVIHIGDTHRRIAELDCQIALLKEEALDSSFRAGKIAEKKQRLLRVVRKLDGQAKAQGQYRGRMRRLLERAPDHVQTFGEAVLAYLESGVGTYKQAIETMNEVADYASREGRGRRFALHFRHAIEHRRKTLSALTKSEEQLAAEKASVLEELVSLESEATEAELRRRAEQLHQESAAAREQRPELENQHVRGLLDGVKMALARLGFEPVEEIATAQRAEKGTVSIPRQIYAREGAAPSGSMKQRESELTQFDVFLSHNSRDKTVVRGVAAKLRKRGLRVWYDEWELTPGRSWQRLLEEGLRGSRSVAVLVGNEGLGPWTREEMEAAMILAVKSGKPIIPVLLPGTNGRPELPLFLKSRTWVDLGGGLTEAACDKLIWGITGEK